MKKRISKLIAVILAIITLFSSFQAFALTEGSKYDYTVKYMNAYYDTGRWETANGKVHDNYGQVTLRTLKSTGEPLYCMQVYEDCNNAPATAEKITDTDVWNKELSRSQQNLWTQVSIYGYSNFDYGYSWENAQLATHTLFWEIETNARKDFSSGCNSWAKSIFKNYPKALECYNKILEACRNHSAIPNFNTTSIELKGVGEKNAVTLTDKNGVLNNFKVSSSNSNVVVNKSGNNLKIWCKTPGNISANLTFTKYNTDINSAFALTGAKQTLFYGTLSDPVTTRLNVKLTQKGMAQFKKTDLETGKEIESKDGVFSVYSWNTNSKTYEYLEKMNYSEEKQAYITSQLPVTTTNRGWYKIVEEKAPSGYVLPTNIEYEFQITEDGQIVNVNNGTITNAAQKGRINIAKQGEVLDDFDFVQTEYGLKYCPLYTTNNLAGSVWEIRANEDIIVNGDIKYHEGELVDTITTTENGATSKPLYLGKYIVREIEAPEGCFIGSNEFEIELKYQGQSVDIFDESFTAHNERQKVKISLEKDMEENIYYPNPEAYNDVVFGVYSDEEIVDSNGNVILKEDSLIDCFKINESGQGISTTDIPFGKWYVKEIQTSEGYVLNDTKYPFEFTPQSQEIPLIWIDLNENTAIENNIIRGSVEGIKKDNHGNVLQGALIGLFKCDETIFNKDTALLTATSDKNGKFSFSNIPFGQYIIKEIEAPEGFVIDNREYPINIYENEQIIEITIINNEIIKPMKSPDTGRTNETVLVLLSFIALSVSLVTIRIFYSRRKKHNK